MKITERIEMIDGVESCYYSFDTMSIAVYYKVDFDLSVIQIRVADAIDKANVHNSIETQNYYSIEDN